LLQASGYRVSFDEADRKKAKVVIDAEGASEQSPDDRTVSLREDLLPGATVAGTIYRYDRAGLMAAIQSKIAGAAS
jgi:two-component system chemotaxis sensor kinase CheA